MSKILLFDKSLQKLNFLFKYSGMNLQNKIMKPIEVIIQRSLFAFNFTWTFSAIIATLYFMYIGIVDDKSFIEITSVAPCSTFSILGVIKSVFHLMYEENVKELIELLRRLEIKENDREKNDEKQKIIDEETGFLNAVINVLYALNFSMIVVFDMTPLVLIAIKYYKTNEFVMLLPYMDVFWFMPYELVYWPFAYIHQVWSECIVLLDMGAADYLFFTCCTYIRIQFRLLKYDFEKVISSKSISNGVFKEDEFRENFTKLVKWHQDLIHSTDVIEIIYSKSTLCNFVSSSFVICLTGFNVTIVDDIETIITYLTFLFMGLLQVYFLCFFGDMLMSASEEISSAVYNCQWYYGNAGAVRQKILIVQTRAQQPCKLTASGFADVNLKAFMRVLSTAWSYFALLQTLFND